MKTKNIFGAVINYLRRADIFSWLIIVAVSVYSLALLKSVSLSPYVKVDYAKTQFFAICLGVAGAFFITLIDYENWANLWHFFAVFSIVIMIYTYLTAESVQGSGGVDAKAWIFIGGRSFQPSELVKILFIVTFSKHLDTIKKKGLIDSPIQVILLFGHAMVPFMLCQLQGDTGAGIVFLFMFLFMSFSAGIKLRYFIILFVVVAAAMPIIWNFIMKDYQRLRFSAFWNLDDPAIQIEDGWQQYLGRTSIASGGFKGYGLFHGKRVASATVPFQESDFILTVAGEELGFIGIMGVIVLLMLLMFKTLYTGTHARDDLGRYICFGFFGMIAIQSLWNIGMCLALLPVMGVTLPFFSQGGSSAMCLYLGYGFVQNVYMRRKENDHSRLTHKTPMRYPINRF